MTKINFTLKSDNFSRVHNAATLPPVNFKNSNTISENVETAFRSHRLYNPFF